MCVTKKERDLFGLLLHLYQFLVSPFKQLHPIECGTSVDGEQRKYYPISKHPSCSFLPTYLHRLIHREASILQSVNHRLPSCIIQVVTQSLPFNVAFGEEMVEERHHTEAILKLRPCLFDFLDGDVEEVTRRIHRQNRLRPTNPNPSHPLRCSRGLYHLFSPSHPLLSPVPCPRTCPVSPLGLCR